MPGHYSKPKGKARIEGGGKGGTNKVWTEGKNANWQQVTNPAVAGNAALRQFTDSTRIVMTEKINPGASLDAGYFLSKDYNRIMKDVASTVMNVALKTWQDRDVKNRGTKLNP